MKVKKITAADRKLMVAAVGKLSPKEKDQAIADLILFAQRVIPIIDELTKDSTLST